MHGVRSRRRQLDDQPIALVVQVVRVAVIATGAADTQRALGEQALLAEVCSVVICGRVALARYSFGYQTAINLPQWRPILDAIGRLTNTSMRPG